MIAKSLRAVVAALDEAKVRYFVVGPLAVAAHGCMPFTDNLDLRLVMEGAADFEAMYKRVEWFALEAGVVVPVCGYGDLVRLKRRSGRSDYLVDLDSLEKVRRPRPAYDPWYECTFEGNELWKLWRWADLSFGEKIRSLEESWKVSRMFLEARR